MQECLGVIHKIRDDFANKRFKVYHYAGLHKQLRFIIESVTKGKNDCEIFRVQHNVINGCCLKTPGKARINCKWAEGCKQGTGSVNRQDSRL